MAVLGLDGLDRLVEVLIERRYRVVGPTVRDEAIVLSELTSASQLPAGWGVDVAPGEYRLRRRADAAVFGHSAGPMGTGPAVGPGYDLALGSERSAEVLAALPTRLTEPGEVDEARAAVDAAVGRMGRATPAANLPAVLVASRDSSHWAEIASRCLNCATCTMVCPTCFCTTTEDATDLSGDHAERWERWSSCFELDYSYIHGGEMRTSGSSRYRQWLTHKLGTWHEQFGSSGCVGCGRCIAWCPAGIDLTAENRHARPGAGREPR